MRSAAALAAVLLASGCASWRAPAPGPTEDGIAVSVAARDKAAARREALESLLPLFITPAARAEHEKVVEAMLAKPGPLIMRERHPKKRPGVVEVRVDAMAMVLTEAGALAPKGYETGPQIVLIAFGDRAAPAPKRDKFTADAFEVALFGRGIQAKDADDELSPIAEPLKSKTESDTVAEAGKQGWAWLATGGSLSTVKRAPEAAAYRAKSYMRVSLYGLQYSTEAATVESSGEALDVSSRTAIMRAVEQAAQEAALRVDGAMAQKRAGRATLAVLVAGRKDPAYLAHVISDLRRTPGVLGAALVQWNSLDGMALIHAYARDLKVEDLAARLMHDDASLRIDAIETEDGRLTLEGPEVPESEDTGG